MEPEKIKTGARLLGRGSARIGTVDAVFADYLLVRTAGLLPVDLYVPRAAVTVGPLGPHVDAGRDEAYQRWHRPLKQAPHD
ncbi:MAG: hypothetical protein QOI85_1259 [Chloroflexota bacterium]|nr:hypothetical protein [Chloroflexota bacterium]